MQLGAILRANSNGTPAIVAGKGTISPAQLHATLHIGARGSTRLTINNPASANCRAGGPIYPCLLSQLRPGRKEEDTQKFDTKLIELRERQRAVERAGTRAVNKSIGALRTLLKFCQSRGLVGQNTAVYVKKLTLQTLSERPLDQLVLNPGEIASLIEATDLDWRAAVGVLAYGGLRLGELLGLQWDDVELDCNRILVRRQLCGETGELWEPKTKAGTRFVELPSFVTRHLRTWKLRCPKGELEMCFPNRHGAPMDQYNFRSRVFYAALRRAKLRRAKVHDLRHRGGESHDRCRMRHCLGLAAARPQQRRGHARCVFPLVPETQ